MTAAMKRYFRPRHLRACSIPMGCASDCPVPPDLVAEDRAKFVERHGVPMRETEGDPVPF